MAAASNSSLAPTNLSFRVEKESPSSAGRDKSGRRERPSSISATAASVVEDSSSEKIDSNSGDTSAVIAAVSSIDEAAADPAEADSGSEDAVLSSVPETAVLAAIDEASQLVEADDGSPSLVAWQARDVAAVARQPHPCPLPQALFAPDIVLPPQQAAALTGGAAPSKRPSSRPFLAFMEGLSALQCVSQSGVISLDIERIFPLGPCNDSLR